MLREFEDKENILADMDEQVGRVPRQMRWFMKQESRSLPVEYVLTLLSDQIANIH